MCPSRLCNGLGAMSNVDRVEVWRTLQQIAACISVHSSVFSRYLKRTLPKKTSLKKVAEGVDLGD